jgi:hypothetical protein
MNNLEIYKKILETDNNILNSLDLNSKFKNLLEYDHTYRFLTLESGTEHYRLLSYISTLYNNVKLFDVGTNACRSALSLSYNTNNKIKSYDVIQILDKNPIIENVEYILGDSTEDNDLYDSPFVFLDVNHDGIYENIFYNKLKELNWKGILLLDDIHLNEEMKTFWNNIEYQKHDITSIGHWSGTGIVLFN